MMKDFFKALIKIIVIFFCFEIFSNLIGSYVAVGLFKSLNGKYMIYLVSEVVMVLFVLILCILLKRFKIFKDKNMCFKDSVFLCIPILILSFLVLLGNLNELFKVSSGDLISLILYVICIGLFEETLFRGIIEGILLDEYGSSKKRVIVCILLSGFIFGLVHLSNLLMGQDVLTTMMQFFQSMAIGILFGTIYYVSRNIWALIFLHSFYDFTVLLGEVNLVTGCSYMDNVPMSITFNSLVVSLILGLIYILYSVRLYKKYIDNSKNLFKIDLCLYMCVGLMFLSNILFSMYGVDSSKYYVCNIYDEVSFSKIEVHYYNYDDYVINGIHIYKSNGKAIVGDTVLEIPEVVRVVVTKNNLMIISNEGEYYRLYYSKIEDDGTYDLVSFEVPMISGVGYLKDSKNNVYYPVVKSTSNDLFIVDNNSLKKVIS